MLIGSIYLDGEQETIQHLLVIIMNLLTIGAIAGAVGCSEQGDIHTTEEKVELCEDYLDERGWIKDYNYDYCTFDDSRSTDRYFCIKIYTEGRDYPTVTDVIYYE